MLFNSYIFIFVFLPLCLAGYFLLHRLNKPTLALMWLFGMSLWFYGSQEGSSNTWRSAPM